MAASSWRTRQLCLLRCRISWNVSTRGRTRTPTQSWSAKPAADGRRQLTYGEASGVSTGLATRLIERGLSKSDTICVVAGAGIHHTAIKLACLRAGFVHAPLSPSLVHSETGQARLAAMIEICRPALILVDDRHAETLRLALDENVAEILALEEFSADAGHAEQMSPALAARRSETRPDDPAAIYFTSGSTGDSKGVIITRKMIAAVQSAIAAHWPFLTHGRPSIVDWLPWHHVFGGLDNFFKMMWNGGAYHVRPAPSREMLGPAVDLITDVRPNLYIDVPFGIKLMLDHLENNDQDRAAFFSRLDLIFFAGAGMDAETWSRLNRLIQRSRDHVLPTLRVASGYGSTEAASTICLAHEEPGSPGEIGVPLPGHRVRLVDVDGRSEIRVKGPNVSPGYIGTGGAIPMSLDEAGFLRTGDVVAPVRPFHPELGLRFDGRIAEDFKLTNGTRVKAGALRHMLLSACSPHLGDVAIAGETRDYLSASVVCRARLGGNRRQGPGQVL